ncbi:MAG TPA: ATP-binding cassette domain-containing protein, partial [Deltaproteobacteria bacterium]|nr:ATP-binding cassette domain-containing protein [Deltaproteobacteria bacterium]
GYDTFVGERGALLSGGQKQRIAIARVFLKNPNILILDEATSALDEKNEQAIQNTINTLKERITLIIIAHRLTTVEGCDRVVWLDKGRVRLVGDAKTVIAQFRRQSGEAPEIEGSRGGDA